MKHVVLVAVDDPDVDLLSQLKQNDEVRVGAVFHPDPASLVSRIAQLARFPVVNDRAGLSGLTPDVCIGGVRAAEFAAEWRERALLSGRPAPVFIPVEEALRYLEDVSGYIARLLSDAAALAAATTAEAGTTFEVSTTFEDVVPESPAPPRADSSASGAPAVTSNGHGERVIPRIPPAETPLTDAPAPPAPGDPGIPVAATLGSPSVDHCFELPRLVGWLTEAASRLVGGTMAVIWQREPGGERHTRLGMHPQRSALPTLPTTPHLLEQLIQSGRAQVVSAERLFAGHEMLVPLALVSIPLPGDSGPFGLLGIFRPEALGPLAPEQLAALEQRGPEFGLALERCARFAQMTQELRRLRFRDHLRDFLVSGRLSAPGRWEQLLGMVLSEAPAATAALYRLEPRAGRLALAAVAGDELPPVGGYSVPVGRGFIGAAFQRPGVTVYSRDDLNDAADNHDLYLIPFRTRRAGVDAPVALLLLDGVASRTPSGQQTAAFLEELAHIVAPFLE